MLWYSSGTDNKAKHVELVINDFIEMRWERSVSVNGVDVGMVVAPGRASGMSLTGNSASFRAALWTNLERLADNIFTVYSQVLHLQKVLMRKRDPVTHVLFIDLLTYAQPQVDTHSQQYKIEHVTSSPRVMQRWSVRPKWCPTLSNPGGLFTVLGSI